MLHFLGSTQQLCSLNSLIYLFWRPDSNIVLLYQLISVYSRVIGIYVRIIEMGRAMCVSLEWKIHRLRALADGYDAPKQYILPTDVTLSRMSPSRRERGIGSGYCC